MIKKIIAWYFSFGGLILLLYFLFDVGLNGFISRLLPSLFTVVVMLFYIISGLIYLTKGIDSLIKIGLLFQSIQFSILGFAFKNCFIPYLGFLFTDTPELKITGLYKMFFYQFANGYNKYDDSILVCFNFIPLLILYFVQNRKL